MQIRNLNQTQFPLLKTYLFFVLALIGVLLFAYMYLLSATVVHVVMQKQLNGDIRETNSEVAKLESKFIDMQHSMSDEVASMHGFVEVKEKVFINKTSDSLALLGKGL